ncbi:MAG: hypothetical protein Q8R72_17450 [Hylemonella sp.]|nr:hypothetical protein [Hylemonella sp.]
MTTKILLGVLALATSAAYAQSGTMGAPANPSATPRVDQREANQERRIQQGVNSGQLTPREANRLENRQERVERVEERAKADGKVTPKERAHMDNMQDRNSRDIAREKHDRQRDMNHDGRKDRPHAERGNGERHQGKRN